MLSTPRRLCVSAFALSAAWGMALPAHAEVLFRGNLETGDLKQWGYLLKEEGLSVVTDRVAEGKYAGKVTISKNELWDNGLNRVEVQHKPADAYLTEGKEIYYGFSFYLPETLTEDNHQLLYWETTETYQQVMQLAVEGEHMRFATQKPEWKVQWEADGKATAGKWHRVALHVKWSASADTGQVDLWFDGEQVVTAGKAQTFLGKPAFVQHGILRDTIEKVETLYFDDARSGTTIEDVLAPAEMSGGGAGGGGTGGQATGGAGTPTGGAAGAGGGGSSSDGGVPSGGVPSGGAAGSGATSGGVPSGGAAGSGASTATAGTASSVPSPSDESSCAFSPQPSRSGPGLAALLGLLALRRRRR